MDAGLSEQTDRIESYLEQALFYSRSAEVEKDYLIKPVILQKVIEDSLLQKKRELLEKHASVDLHDLEKTVYSDGKWMEFIISQILDNSIKYSGEQNTSLEIYGSDETEKVLLMIKDHGVGVSGEEVSRVFDKGFTGTNGRKYKKSTGIGLYLCKKLCKRLGHEILFSSVPGEGSTVTIVFPKSGFTDEVR